MQITRSKFQRPRTALAAAALMLFTLSAAGIALANSHTLQASTALTAPGSAPATAAASRAVASVPAGFADLVEKLRPAVVSIEVAGKVGPEMAAGGEDYQRFGEDFFKRFFGDQNKRFNQDQFQRWFKEFRGGRGPGPEMRQRQVKGAGSGFLIDPDGYIVTNDHVVRGADTITVTLYNGENYQAKLIGRDPETDLALVKIEAGKALPYATFGDSDSARVGDWVITVGNPFGLENTVTTGILSARGRSIGAGRFDDFLQIDAPINRGNSGGPAFNTKGEVIGVNTAIFSPSGGSVGIGFAIPSDMVQEIVAELKSDGSVERGWLGVRIQALTEDLANGFGLEKAAGALVAEVTPHSPAATAGFRTGDVIVAVNGEPVPKLRDLTRAIARIDPGKSAEIALWRDGKAMTLDVDIGRFPKTEQMAALDSGAQASEAEVLGMQLARIDEAARRAYGLEPEAEGVVILAVEPDSLAARKGLAPGDLILKAGAEEVATPADVKSAVETAKVKDRKSVLLLVSRAAQERFVALPLSDA